MTRAVKNLMLQQCWARGAFEADTNVFVVEPFSNNSELIHGPEIWSELKEGNFRSAARFSDYYNLGHYNMKSVKSNSAELISWEEFILRSPKKAIAITIPMFSCSSERQNKKCKHSKKFIRMVNSLINNVFDEVAFFCVSCSSSSIPFKLQKILSLHFRKVGSLSIFIDSWRNYAFTRSWLQLPVDCKEVEYADSSDRLLPSNVLLNHSIMYQTKYAQGKFQVAVMLRIERFLTLLLSNRSNTTVNACLEEVLSIHDKLKFESTGNTFVAVDIGRYGSGKMQKENQYFQQNSVNSIDNITGAVKIFFNRLYHGYITLSNWEETFPRITNGIVERGYIASLQQNLASQADCLILMGGGSFQEVAGFQYINKHQNNSLCIHTICTSNKFKVLFEV